MSDKVEMAIGEVFYRHLAKDLVGEFFVNFVGENAVEASLKKVWASKDGKALGVPETGGR